MTPRPSPGRILTAAAAGGEWDLVVIGAGSAGLVAARTAATLGARTLLIEAHRWGGECLHTGCVPSKALIAAGHAAHAARRADRLGVRVAGVEVDFTAVMAHVHAAIATIAPVDSPETLASRGVHVVHGRARFTAPREIEVDGTRIGFRDAVIATGSRPVIADIPGAQDVLTNETFWQLEEQPARLLVHGGGAIGCEIAQAMARLGTAVTLVHRGSRLLPKEDPAASAIVRAALEADGVDVRLDTQIDRIESDRTAVLSDGSRVGFDRMLAALGRRVDVSDLGLEAAEVALGDRGDVTVDTTMRTSNPAIRAAGDVTGLPRFTHTAGMFGSVAATNAVLGLSRRIDLDVVPRVTFTSPEVGAVGVAPGDAKRRGLSVIVHEDHEVDRAVADGETSGRTTLVVDRRGRLRGASVVGPRAGEVLGELTTAIKAGLSVRDLAGTTHAYPTYADGAWNAAISSAQEGLDGGLVQRGIRLLRGFHARRR
ncbi:FAD-dependent oxidoreductase [Planococcus sp. APC 4015]|nr:FAD-dependent oxidoreductase [Planococcus sp. APC 4015]